MSEQIPPWLKEQIEAYNKTRINLQNLVMQMTNMDGEKLDAEHAIEELKNTTDTAVVYKRSGSIMVQSDKQTLIQDLQEQLEMCETRDIVMEKQKKRLEQSLMTQEAKINAALTGGAAKPPG